MNYTGIIGGAPFLTSNFLCVYLENTIQIPATTAGSYIIYDTIQTACDATSYDTTTGVFTLNYPGKYLLNLKARCNTGSFANFNPNISLYMQVTGLSQGLVGRQNFYFCQNATTNNRQNTANFRRIINVSAGETFQFQTIMGNTYGSGYYDCAGQISQGSRSTVVYLGQ